MDKLIIYGSFNCPYCYLASAMLDQVAPEVAANIQWRAVVHDSVPAAGLPVEGERADQLDREVADVARRGGADFVIHRPGRYPDTTVAVATYATADGAEADRIRRALFRAYWVDGLDIGDPAVVRELAGRVSLYSTRMRTWQQEWLSLPRPAVPLLVGADGVPHSALRRLEELARPVLPRAS
jgi:predicted DsbA family dithiol-disulfide isomerase